MLRVMDNDELIEFEFEDLRKYHGSKSICGLTVSYVIMEAAFDALAGLQPLDRAGLRITSAFPGPGARDGFELVTRTLSRDTYQVDTSIEPSAQIAEAAKGAYYFKVSDGRRSVELGLKPAVVPETFVPLRRKQLSGRASPDELAKFRTLQFAFSESLLARSAKEAVNVLDLQLAAAPAASVA